MKKIAYLFIIMISASTLAQKPMQKQKVQERIWQRKLIFMKENLMLNQKEAQEFETAYKEYTLNKLTLNKRFKTDVIGKIKNGGLSELSEKEKEQIIEKYLNFDKERYELNRDFTIKLTHILPSEKVIRFFKLERQFDRELLKRLKKRRMKEAPGKPREK